MPTVLRADGFDIRIFSNDHAPAHVHVIKAGGEVVIELTPIGIRSIHAMNTADVRKARRIVESHHGLLITAWRKIHGNDKD